MKVQKIMNGNSAFLLFSMFLASFDSIAFDRKREEKEEKMNASLIDQANRTILRNVVN